MIRARFAGRLLAAVTLFGAAGCSSPAAPSMQPAHGLPQITCPVPVTVASHDGAPLIVTFPAPTVQAGTPPVSSACLPASGAAFSVGATSVTCTATDAGSHTASCSFLVTVLSPPKISATRFVAFGDSTTEGKLSDSVVDTPDAYPTKLTFLLQARYTAQSIVVLNEGLGGEETAAGLLRLPMVFARDQMDVLLLDEGANDLLGHGASAIPDVVNNLRAMIRQARNRNIAVFVSTLLPERPEGSRGGAWQLITPTNAQITAMVAAESAVLVDTYTPLAQDVSTFIGDDGLHPTPAGYQRMAEIFFQVLRDRLEIAPSALPGRFSVLRGTAGR